MKELKVIVAGVLLVCFSISAHAQTEKGKYFIGGGTNLSLSIINSKMKSDEGTENDGDFTSLSLSPKVGYFVMDGVAIGTEFPMSYSKAKYPDGYTFKSYQIAIAPFLKYYAGTGKVVPFFEGKVGFGKVKVGVNNTIDPFNDYTTSLFLYSIKGGLGFFLNERIAIELAVGYSYQSYKADDDNPNNEKRIRSGLESGIGFVILF